MAEYSSLKVPELKKLLQEKGLPQTGNKADLVARLQQSDKKDAPEEAKPGKPPRPASPARPAPILPSSSENKDDEINYSDDDATAAPAAEPAAEAAAAPESAAEGTTAPESAEKPADATAENDAEAEAKATEAAPQVPAQNFAIGLSSTAADEEARKRADRAKRFGIEEDDDTKKRAERAKRFGIDDKELATGLDSALPEKSLKRGRGRAEGEGNRPEKRQTPDRRGGRRDNNNRRGPPPASNGDNRRGRAAAKPSILNDPVEKAKAEKRAARFASG
ncbi:hypothetical protein S40288_04417 [Stachybotrys chartarum IBT 40288]|nr:hypothetical protein S40288_04417 [Stachybotrys chartarum IBT 40288]